MNAHKPKAGFGLFSVKKIASTVSWTVGLAIMALIFIWAIRTIATHPQPAAENTLFPSSCPVTPPNGSIPPGETVESPEYLGNGQLWTVLWPDGKVYMTPINQEADGSFNMKWGWWRATNGALTIEGHRLDAESEPLRADIPDGYGDTGFQVSALIFPSTGCWEVTGRVGDVSLTFVTEVVFGIATPTPVSLTVPISTPALGEQLYNWNGLSLYLKTSLPESPAEANVYLAPPDQSAIIESAQALAEQFGIQGEVYLAPDQMRGAPNSYLVTAGGPRLYISSSNYFIYYSDYGKENAGGGNISDEQARAVIDDFMVSHSFDFEYQIKRTSEDKGSFQVIPLLDKRQLQYNNQLPAGLKIELDDDEQVFSVYGVLYSGDLLGQYPIRSSAEAFQFMVNTQTGTLQSVQSANPINDQIWQRTYPDNQYVSIYGYVTANESAEMENHPFLTIDEYPVSGNTIGLEKIGPYKLVIATGKFRSVNGIRQFIVKGWKISGATTVYAIGCLLRMDNDQLILIDTNYDEMYVLTDFPKDIPQSVFGTVSQLGVSGFLLSDGSLEWKTIQYYPYGSQGTRGGITSMGNNSLYKLNFSGTPIPLPTPFPTRIPLSTTEAGELLYTVQPGDTFGSIAQKFNISVEALMKANNISDLSMLSVGISLIIPDKSLEAATNQPNLMNGDEINNEDNADVIIENVELVYFIADPRFEAPPAPFVEPIYIQPMWRFTGHHRYGGLVEILVQALKDDFLSPEIQVIQGP